MAYPYGIGPNRYVTSILISNLTQECMHKPLLRSPKLTSKRGRGRANPFRTINSSPDPLCMHFPGP